jgi:hypothetical protein
MASAVDIVNIALARLGDSATVTSIDPPEGSAQAEQAKRFYPIARDTLLELHPWNFATKRISLAVTSDVAPDTWQFTYSLPANYIRALAVYPEETNSEADQQPFIIETNELGQLVLFTNVENATLKYISLITDTTKFTPLFVNTLSFMLASFMAGSLIKGDMGIKIADTMYNKAMQMMNVAAGKDAAARNYDAQKQHVPTWTQQYGISDQRSIYDADGRILRD